MSGKPLSHTSKACYDYPSSVSIFILLLFENMLRDHYFVINCTYWPVNILTTITTCLNKPQLVTFKLCHKYCSCSSLKIYSAFFSKIWMKSVTSAIIGMTFQLFKFSLRLCLCVCVCMCLCLLSAIYLLPYESVFNDCWIENPVIVWRYLSPYSVQTILNITEGKF